MTWDNYHLVINEWSLSRGIDAFIANFLIYFGAGIVVDLFFNGKEHFKSIFLRGVVFIDSGDDVIELKNVS